MPHDRLRGPLGWSVAGTLLLPVVLSLVLGLAGLAYIVVAITRGLAG